MKDHLQKGLTEKSPITQKKPRGETKGSMTPLVKKEKVKGDDGKSFTIK